MRRTIITGTGHYIPKKVQTNQDFSDHSFYDADQNKIDTPPEVIAQKFEEITGIGARRYVDPNMHTSDIGTIAAQRAIEDSGIDPETIDQLIFAHNFGDVKKGTIQTDVLPALAARVKHNLKISNPRCVAYDILFGCPGWVQGVIQADAFFKAGIAKTALVIGAETLSRVLDDNDRDSMIFSDGAGASVLEYSDADSESGIYSASSLSHTIDEAFFLFLGKSNHPEADPNVRYIKMHGRKVYEYALSHVPAAMKECVEAAGIDDVSKIKKIFIHQANEKLDEGVVKRFYRLYGEKVVPADIMPMSVHEFGNSSVATVPTLFDRVRRGDHKGHNLHEGDYVIFASVGSGMNINAVCYKI
mgnify:CR=1 FL=1